MILCETLCRKPQFPVKYQLTVTLNVVTLISSRTLTDIFLNRECSFMISNNRYFCLTNTSHNRHSDGTNQIVIKKYFLTKSNFMHKIKNIFISIKKYYNFVYTKLQGKLRLALEGPVALLVVMFRPILLLNVH